jgi:DNA-binding transcriptional ArsR family regulator
MSQPVVSKHLRILRDAGLVSVKPDGQRRLYSVNPEPLIELEAWLEPYRRFWDTKLDSLEQHLDDMD